MVTPITARNERRKKETDGVIELAHYEEGKQIKSYDQDILNVARRDIASIKMLSLWKEKVTNNH